MNPKRDALWSFETDRFFVGFYAEPEEMDPADTFQFDEDIEAVRSGKVEWFCAQVSVYLKDEHESDWLELGSDYLGGCAYTNVSEFYNERGSYFSDMVRAAIADARRHLAKMPAVHA